MMDKQLNKIQIEQLKLKDSADRSSQHKRRRLLKGTVALPVIMTLYSGAALARTSNLVGEADSVDSAVKIDEGTGDRLLCVLKDPNQEQIRGGPYDLGPTPMGYYENNLDSQGHFINLNRQLSHCHREGGIMISATAFASIQSIIRIT